MNGLARRVCCCKDGEGYALDILVLRLTSAFVVLARPLGRFCCERGKVFAMRWGTQKRNHLEHLEKRGRRREGNCPQRPPFSHRQLSGDSLTSALIELLHNEITVGRCQRFLFHAKLVCLSEAPHTRIPPRVIAGAKLHGGCNFCDIS